MFEARIRSRIDFVINTPPRSAVFYRPQMEIDSSSEQAITRKHGLLAGCQAARA